MLGLILETDQSDLWKSYTIDRSGVFWTPHKDLCTSLIHAEKWKGRKKETLQQKKMSSITKEKQFNEGDCLKCLKLL